LFRPAVGRVLARLLTLMIFGLDLNNLRFWSASSLGWHRKKNAIMMIDFAIDAQRNHGKSPAEAIHEGCLLPFFRADH